MLHAIAKQFRQPSGFAGKIVSGIMKKLNKPEYEIVIPALEIKPKDHILEIGYGHGIGIDMICSSFDCQISGIDFSKLMFKEASKRNKLHITNNKVDLHFGNYLTYNFDNRRYDKAFCINVIYFWDNLAEPFNKMKTLLNPGGIFCIHMADLNNPNRPSFTKKEIFNKYTIEQVVAALNAAGFTDINYSSNMGYLIRCQN